MKKRKCLSKKILTGEKLSQEHLQHIQKCENCREGREEYLEEMLIIQLAADAIEHPAFSLLWDYAVTNTSGETEHINSCPTCCHRVREIRAELGKIQNNHQKGEK